MVFFFQIGISQCNEKTFPHNFARQTWITFLGESSKLIGSGNLFFFGFKLYEIALIGPKEISSKNYFDYSFALTLKYSKSFNKERIANISKKEINKLKIASSDEIKIWHKWMLQNFPDITSGDTLTGIYSPKDGIQIYYNRTLFAENESISFAKAFFSIWLHEKTSEPKLRRKILNISN